MPTDDLPNQIRHLLYAQEHRLLDDGVGLAAIRAVWAGVADGFVDGLIRDRVRRHKVTQAFAGPFPIPQLQHGDCVLGLDDQDRVLRSRIDWLNAHSLTLGSSGSGKTTRSRFMALQICPRIEGAWLFDFRKREYRALRPLLGRVGIDLLIVRARQLKLNPLQIPESVEPSDWAPRVSDMLVQVLGLPLRASKLLHATCIRMYDRLGVLCGSGHFPTLRELRETIAADGHANPQAKQAIVDSLDPILLSVGAVFDYRVGWSSDGLDGLAHRHIVFELDGIAETEKDLILSTLVLPEFASRVARGVSNPGRMDLWICCDEAARLVSAANRTSGVADLIGLIRGTGIGLDLSVQSSDIAPVILSNTASKFIGRCGSAADYDTISAALGLTPEQRVWMRRHLTPGVFIGQLGEGGWRQPFVMRVPPMSIANTVGDEEAVSSARVLDSLRVVPVVKVEATDIHPRGGKEADAIGSDTPFATAGTGRAASAADLRSQTGPVPGGILDEADLRYLRAVVGRPGQPSSMYPKLARLSPSRATAIRKRLVHAGYLRVHSVATGKCGRHALVVEPLEPARRAVGATGGGT